MSKIHLRDYQVEAAGAIRAAWSGGMQRPACVLPTGAGKTVVFTDVVERALPEVGRALVLAHRDELIEQAVAKFRAVAPHIRVGVVKAGRNEVGAPVVVGSVQTLRSAERRRMLRGVGLVVVDECHHATSQSYMDILEHYGCFGGGDALAAGFTATMARGDGAALGKVWQSVVYERDIRYMITRGFLVAPRGIRVDVEDLDLSKVRRVAGDYSDGAMGLALASSMAPERIVDAYREHAKDRPGLLFVPTVEFAELMVEKLTAGGFTAALVHGGQGVAERRLRLAQFTAGVVQILVNCMVLTEGTDLPLASCVVIARPTTHASLYVQMVGRVLRPYPGKTDALVLDVVGASARHKLAGLVDLIGEGGREALGEDEEHEAGPVDGWVDLDDGVVPYRDGKLISTEVDLFHGSRAAWLRTHGGTWFIPTDSRYIAIVPSRTMSDAWDVVSIDAQHVGVSSWIQRDVPDLGYAMAHGESAVTVREQMIASKAKPWRDRPAGVKALHAARRIGLDVKKSMKTGEVTNLMRVQLASARIDPRVGGR